MPARQCNLFEGEGSQDFFAAGVDEAGRGCLAGPVVAAAVILPEKFDLPGLADSKLLSPAKRNELAPRIRQCAIAFGLGVAGPRSIETNNILQATFIAMARAANALHPAPDILNIDGKFTLPAPILEKFYRSKPWPRQNALVHGDRTDPSISAASILAKTFRDALMVKFDHFWPEYGFARHKGYGVKMHLDALRKFGACPLHRRTFRGVPENHPHSESLHGKRPSFLP